MNKRTYHLTRDARSQNGYLSAYAAETDARNALAQWQDLAPHGRSFKELTSSRNLLTVELSISATDVSSARKDLDHACYIHGISRTLAAD